jgi:diadenosine tetraphosphatase ApaH/serine/threonine PP2A family protein phosphatase
MKLGVLADIHSNLTALKCALDALKDADGFICPGDIVGYGPDPNECVEVVEELNCRTVAGNHDAACLERLDTASFNSDAKEAIKWTTKVLTPVSRKFLEALSEHIKHDDFEIVHGSLRSHLEEYITNIQVGAASLELMEKKICFVGHLHIPLVMIKDKKGNYDGWQLNDGDVVDASKFEKVIVNVGSVGQPRDADPRASFGIFDTEAKTIEIRKIGYNIAAVQEKMRKAGLPDFLIERLVYGR